MAFFVTLVASAKPLTPAHIAGIGRYLDSQGIGLAENPDWLDPHRAADIPVANRPRRDQIGAMREALATDKIDLLVAAAQGRRKKVLIADMDSTITTSEALDELARHAGCYDRIAAITERAMRGEIDFAAALRERVAMLEGLPEESLRKTVDETELTPGAETLVRTMAARGAVCVLVSGGFTVFTEDIARRAGFRHHHGNVFAMSGGKLTGGIDGPVLDRDAKLAFLHQYAPDPAEALALGDGANDLPMLAAAGMGIGFHPKPLLRENLDNCILYGDLSAALYAQGYRSADFS